jgi:hypothetical protein
MKTRHALAIEILMQLYETKQFDKYSCVELNGKLAYLLEISHLHPYALEMYDIAVEAHTLAKQVHADLLREYTKDWPLPYKARVADEGIGSTSPFVEYVNRNKDGNFTSSGELRQGFYVWALTRIEEYLAKVY